MKEVNVYGSGCKNCTVTAELIKAVGQEKGYEIKINKVKDLEAIMNAGVVSTPAVGIDGKLVHSGSVPSKEQVETFLA
ncbi:thioredoxin family protein [Sansalvadorimonas sp. 2012CJ34-2]|uniref:Thioredoxin family protein n=1 Tax=Parendozoicomonas callyspongiae TaxID=2942213 RepID=A0ABT0PE69_9GAMM|nr:thioredoxin family protein [Sansalvadorimonas sp. 2012CJ34-2]MCL6269672.1 thioredoxin family protein [Sansalvadorimonas sp. 2012CJ34-2]